MNDHGIALLEKGCSKIWNEKQYHIAKYVEEIDVSKWGIPSGPSCPTLYSIGQLNLQSSSQTSYMYI